MCKNCPTHPAASKGTKGNKLCICDKCYKAQIENSNKQSQLVNNDFQLPAYLQTDPGKVREESYFTHGKQDPDVAPTSSDLPKYLQEGIAPPVDVRSKRTQFQRSGTGLSFEGPLGIDPRDQHLEERLAALKETEGQQQELPTESELHRRLDQLRGFSVESSQSGEKPAFPLRLIVQSSHDIPEDDLLGQLMAEKEFESAILRTYSKPDKEFEERKSLFSENPGLLDELEMMEYMDGMQLDEMGPGDVRSKPGLRVGVAHRPPSPDLFDPNFDANVERLIRETMEEVRNDRIVEATEAKVDPQLYERMCQIRGDLSPSSLRPLSPSRIREEREDPELETGGEETFSQMMEAIGYEAEVWPHTEQPRESLFADDSKK